MACLYLCMAHFIFVAPLDEKEAPINNQGLDTGDMFAQVHYAVVISGS